MKKPRIAVSLEPEDYATLKKLSELQERSMSKVAAECLNTMMPALRKLIKVLETSKEAEKEVFQSLRSASNEAAKDAEPMLREFLSQLDLLSGKDTLN